MDIQINNDFKVYRYSLMVFVVFLASIVLLLLILLVLRDDHEEITFLPIDVTPETGTTSPVIRELSGTVVSIDPSGEFMRVAVADEGIFSVGLKEFNSDQPNSGSSLSDLMPMSFVTITVEVTDDTDRYDFIVEEEVIRSLPQEGDDSAEMTVEERVERLRQLTADTIQEN